METRYWRCQGRQAGPARHDAATTDDDGTTNDDGPAPVPDGYVQPSDASCCRPTGLLATANGSAADGHDEPNDG